MAQPVRRTLKKANLAAFENFLMAKYERLARVTETRSYPYVMTIDPSSICQLRCPNCYTGLINQYRKAKVKAATDFGPPSRLSRGVLDAIFDECGDVLFYCHFYNWGEPLLNDALPDFIRAASERDIATKIDTNLSLRLTDSKLEELLLSGLGELTASIDGFSQQTYERYRVGGRFALVRDNLTRLAEMRDRLGAETKITWKFLVFDFNEHEVPDVIAFCDRYGIEFLAADPVVFGSTVGWLPQYRRDGKPNPYRQARAEPQSAEWHTPAGLLPLFIGRPEGRSCAWHYSYATVNANGGMAPCCGAFGKRWDFGDVSDAPGSFGRVWNNANFAEVRHSFPDPAAPAGEWPAAGCAQCTRSENFRDHYAVLDREIMRKYWSFPPESEVRWLDEYYLLLQRSPEDFAAAYAARYREAANAVPVRQTDVDAIGHDSAAAIG